MKKIFVFGILSVAAFTGGVDPTYQQDQQATDYAPVAQQYTTDSQSATDSQSTTDSQYTAEPQYIAPPQYDSSSSKSYVGLKKQSGFKSSGRKIQENCSGQSHATHGEGKGKGQGRGTSKGYGQAEGFGQGFKRSQNKVHVESEGHGGMVKSSSHEGGRGSIGGNRNYVQSSSSKNSGYKSRQTGSKVQECSSKKY